VAAAASLAAACTSHVITPYFLGFLRELYDELLLR
jgi:hypothetical protein